MKYRTAALVALVAGSESAAAADEVTPAATVICTPQPVICTTIAASSNDRFTPFVQHLLVRSQLESQPKGWQMVFLYVPSMDTRALEELQIRFLDELLARQKAEGAPKAEVSPKGEAAQKPGTARESGDETDEGGVEEPHTWTKPPKEGGGAAGDKGAKRSD